MPKYAVYHSSRFDKELSKFDVDFRKQVDNIEEQLKENPYIGKPLDAKWFREKRQGKRRVYFVIYEELTSVLMVAISEKKDQQKVITTVRFMFSFFKEELRKIADKEKFT